MGKVVEKKRKKKGRPSLLDLQKRTIKQQQHLLQQQKQRNSNPNYRNTTTPPTPTPIRRSTRRNPDPDLISQSEPDSEDDDDEEEDQSQSNGGKRREKKLKLVVRLPPHQHPTSLNSNAQDNVNILKKKRKINAIALGSPRLHSQKEEKSVPGTVTLQGSKVDGGPSTPLPDNTLLMFILDRLQKKDTYGVFSEPVDPKELPDYHEIIEHPMDFTTVKQKLAGGAYVYLEQFEGDVFLICSNAMQYNAPDTIYFRQARSIQELATKNFENLRQDSDNNEPGLKIARRGRPPTKHLKKPMGRPSLERAGSEFSDATLATGGENTNWSSYDLKKGPHILEKSCHGSRSSEVYTSLLTEHKFDGNEELTGSRLKGVKHGKKQSVPDESRRNTYMQCQPSACVREPPVSATFDGEKKMLLAVGLHSEHGYARSLGRFAANLGPVVWKIASNKIERSLPAGIKFGPGWVGENDVTLQRPMLIVSTPSGQLSPSESLSLTRKSTTATTSSATESKSEKLFEKSEGDNSSEKHIPSALTSLDGHPSKPLPPSTASPSIQFVHNKSSETSVKNAGAVKGLDSNTGLNIPNSSVGVIGPRPPFQIHPGPMIHCGMNGYNGAHGLNLSPQRGKLLGAVKPASFNFQAPRTPGTISRTNTNILCPVTSNNLNSEDPKLSENSSRINSGTSLVTSGCEGLAASRLGLYQQQVWDGLSTQQKPDLVPPDLNVSFQSPGSPSSSRVDSMQPDLALQL